MIGQLGNDQAGFLRTLGNEKRLDPAVLKQPLDGGAEVGCLHAVGLGRHQFPSLGLHLALECLQENGSVFFLRVEDGKPAEAHHLRRMGNKRSGLHLAVSGNF